MTAISISSAVQQQWYILLRVICLIFLKHLLLGIYYGHIYFSDSFLLNNEKCVGSWLLWDTLPFPAKAEKELFPSETEESKQIHVVPFNKGVIPI